MRNLSSLLTSRTSPALRRSESRPRTNEKSVAERKPAPKRSLNEAAHKLSR